MGMPKARPSAPGQTSRLEIARGSKERAGDRALRLAKFRYQLVDASTSYGV